jgi:5-hydroxyisourate hydrolase
VSVTLEGRGAPGVSTGPARHAGPGEDARWHSVATGATDADGRLRFPDAVPAGGYRLTFATGAWFAARGTQSFYPEVTVTFTVADGHYHVPLLLSPFAYSTYRGS